MACALCRAAPCAMCMLSATGGRTPPDFDPAAFNEFGIPRQGVLRIAFVPCDPCDPRVVIVLAGHEHTAAAVARPSR